MKASMRSEIVDRVERSFGEQCDFLLSLVSHRSLPGHEGSCQAFFAETCSNLGLEVELCEASPETVSRHPAYIDTGVPYGGRPNVIARRKGKGADRSLILNGHADVVSVEPVSEWTADPWKGAIRGGLLYGRGASDMKGGLSANLFAVRALMDCGLEVRGDVILESVIEEELGGSGGTLACFLRGVTADAMIISEPSREGLWISHPGIKYFRVRVKGRPAHAARSHEGVNAAAKMVPIIRALGALDESRAHSLSYPLLQQETGRACNLSIGIVRAGDWVSTVAGWAVIEGRIGFPPGERGEDVREEVARTIREATADDPWFDEHPAIVEWFGWDAEPWMEDEASPLVQALVPIAEGVFGGRPRITASSGGLDTRFGTMFGVPSLAFGPKGGNYHGVDEFVDLDSLKKVTQTLALFAADWCGIG